MCNWPIDPIRSRDTGKIEENFVVNGQPILKKETIGHI